MAKFSMKRGGKEVGQAAVYAKPHTMSGKPLSIKDFTNPKGAINPMPIDYISVGNISNVNYEKPPKRGTQKMRGCGAAIKGITHSDKMG